MAKVNTENQSRQTTAKNAIKILLNKKIGFKEPNSKERLNLIIAFSMKNKVIYGKAFDIIRFSGKPFDLENLELLQRNLNQITIYEVKSTAKKDIKKNFIKYFFGLTTAEHLVAQNLKDSYKFIFVNTITGETLELSLKEVFSKAKGIYPSWSIQF